MESNFIELFLDAYALWLLFKDRGFKRMLIITLLILASQETIPIAAAGMKVPLTSIDFLVTRCFYFSRPKADTSYSTDARRTDAKVYFVHIRLFSELWQLRDHITLYWFSL